MPRTKEGAYTRLWEDAAGDVRLDALTAEEFRVWVRLLALSSRDEGSFYLDEATVVLASRGDMVLLERTIARSVALGFLAEDGIDAWRFVNYQKRNPVRESDRPEKVRQRVADSRLRRKKGDIMASSIALPNEGATNVSRYSNAIQENPPDDDVVVERVVNRTPETVGETTGGVGGPIRRIPESRPTTANGAANVALPAARSGPEGADRVSNSHPTQINALEARTTADVSRYNAVSRYSPDVTRYGNAIHNGIAIQPDIMESSIALQKPGAKIGRTPEEAEVIGVLTGIVQEKGRFGEDRGDPDTERLRKIARKFPGVSLIFVASNYAETTLTQPPTWPRFEMWVRDEAGKMASKAAPTPTGDIKAFATRSRSFASKGAKP